MGQASYSALPAPPALQAPAAATGSEPLMNRAGAPKCEPQPCSNRHWIIRIGQIVAGHDVLTLTLAPTPNCALDNF